jgi:hypothetical protein
MPTRKADHNSDQPSSLQRTWSVEDMLSHRFEQQKDLRFNTGCKASQRVSKRSVHRRSRPPSAVQSKTLQHQPPHLTASKKAMHLTAGSCIFGTSNKKAKIQV